MNNRSGMDIHLEKYSEDAPGYFKHTALNHNAPSIRLIFVHEDRSPEGYIQCEVRHTTIDSAYTCLSYVWGDETTQDCKITMNGKTLLIRENLWQFLRVARRKRTYSWLWIDALCIDQANDAERVHQVQQMGRIFSEAQEVISWLGTSEDIAHFLSVIPPHRPLLYPDGFHDFCNSEYWDRAWITQEVVLSRRTTLMARNEALDMARLPPLLIGSARTERLDGLRPQNSASLKGKGLIYLLHKFRFKESHLARDRVFSLLSLCGEGADLPVDYKISRERLAYNILTSCPRSFCLCSIKLVRSVLRLEDHPSQNFRKEWENALIAKITLPLVWSDGINAQDSPYSDESSRAPVARCHTPAKALIKNQPFSFTFNNEHLCYMMYSDVAVRIEPSHTHFTYQLVGDDQESQPSQDRRFPCQVIISRDRSIITMRVSLSFLVGLGKHFFHPCGIVHGSDSKRVKTYNKRVLRLCEDEDETAALSS